MDMRGLKNFVARRRPTGIPDTDISAPARLQVPEPEDDIAEGVAAPVDDPGLTPVDLQQISKARAGRDHVPGHAALQHEPVRPTLGSAMPSAAPGPSTRQAAATPPPAALPRIWDLDAPAEDSGPKPADPAPAAIDSTSAPQEENPLSPVFRTEQRAQPARPKTRLLGFHADETQQDVFGGAPAASGNNNPRFPIGWIVVVEGPGRGASFTLAAGLSTIGRDPGQTVSLDFGDTAISREGHVSIAYDEEDNRAYIGHGGKANIVRLNDKPLLTTEELHGGDTIRIGETALRFAAFCNDAFSWQRHDTDPADG